MCYYIVGECMSACYCSCSSVTVTDSQHAHICLYIIINQPTVAKCSESFQTAWNPQSAAVMDNGHHLIRTAHQHPKNGTNFTQNTY